DLGARVLQLLLGGLGGVLGDALEDRLRGRLHEVLGLLQAQAGHELAHDLDDLDLLLARGLEDDVELVLLLLDGGGGRTGGRGGRDGDRRGGGDVERLLELLHELGELDQGELLERVEQLVGGELRHGGGSSLTDCGGGQESDAGASSAGASVGSSAGTAATSEPPSSSARLSASACARRATCDAGAAN